MNTEPSIKASETDFEWLENATDADIDYSDIPPTSPEKYENAVLRRNGKVIQKRDKVRVNMYLDADLVTHFKQRAGGRGYQTLINEALRESLRKDDLEALLRKVVREEMGSAEIGNTSKPA